MPDNDYFIDVIECDVQLILAALNYFCGRQAMMFRQRAKCTESFARELEAYKERQDAAAIAPKERRHAG